MEVRTTYIGTIDGKKAIVNGNKPDDMMVEEERLILYPSSGFVLKDKEGNMHSCVWLKDGDSQDNYIEEEREIPQLGSKR